MDIGVTGTSHVLGMTREQQEYFTGFLETTFAHDIEVVVLHHGDCIGADAQAHDIARRHGCVIVIHPPTITKKRAFKMGDIECPHKPFLDRNHDIVDESEILLAFPHRFEEELRSGTWATVRYARKQGRNIIIVWPDGTTTVEEAQ